MRLKKNMCIVLIGGNGFLGKSFKTFLEQLGLKVVVIGRRQLESADKDYFSINAIDLKRPETFLNLSVDHVIFDFAYTSIPNTSFENPIQDFSENLLNVIRHLEFGKAIGVKKYIYVSSGGTVYGNHGELKLREDQANFPVAPYGITKLACERYVHMYCEVDQLPGVIVRPANIYGPGQIPFRGQGLVATVMASIYQHKPILMYSNGEAVRDYIYIEDLNSALLDVIEYGVAGEIYNIGSGTGISVKEMCKAIENETAPFKIDSYKLLPGRPFDIRYNVLECAKIKSLNNWEVKTELAFGLKNTKEWMEKYLATSL